jgi:hypothetical protein
MRQVEISILMAIVTITHNYSVLGRDSPIVKHYS